MIPALHAELLKLRTTRTFAALTLAALAICAVFGVLTASFRDEGPGAASDVLQVTQLLPFFALVLGILAITSEFRHGTITPSLLAVSDRLRLLGAKLVAQMMLGLVFGIVVCAVTLALGWIVSNIRGDDDPWTSAVFGQAVGAVLATVLAAALGVGIGGLIRNQAGALVAALGWIMFAEPLVGVLLSMISDAVGDAVLHYGISGLLDATAGGWTADMDPDGGPGTTFAAVLLAVYSAVAFVGAWLLLERRDVAGG